MICSSCRQTLLSRFPGRGCSPPRIRLMSTVPPISPLHSQSSPEIAVQDSRTSPTSPSTPRISKPLSSPMHPSTSNALRPNQSKQTRLPKLVGSIPGGTPLQGLGYLKAKPTIVAKEDDEYPDWLWRILIPESGAKPTGGKSAADIAALPRAARERYLKKQAKILQSLPKNIPLHEQSKDLTQPGESAEVSLQRRQELTRSSRDARRKAIKEENFLRGM